METYLHCNDCKTDSEMKSVDDDVTSSSGCCRVCGSANWVIIHCGKIIA